MFLILMQKLIHSFKCERFHHQASLKTERWFEKMSTTMIAMVTKIKNQKIWINIRNELVELKKMTTEAMVKKQKYNFRKNMKWQQNQT